MEFTFETTYDRKATTAMAKGLRKTVRKKHSRRSHFFGWIVIILGLLLSWPSDAGIEKKNVVTWIVIAILLLVTVFEDQLNGWLARKRMLPGSAHAKATFTEEGYRSETGAGNTNWNYETISALAETNDYFIFLFGQNHAQVYDKRTMTGGTPEEFRAFLQEKTGKELAALK